MSGQLVGVAKTQATETQLYPLGTLHVDEAGNHYRYLKNLATANTTAYLYYYDPDTFTLVAGITSTVAASGEVHPLCVSMSAVTASYFGWYFVGPGRATITSSGTMVAESVCRTSAGAGLIDDASAGVVIAGLITYDGFASAVTGICKASTELYVSN